MSSLATTTKNAAPGSSNTTVISTATPMITAAGEAAPKVGAVASRVEKCSFTTPASPCSFMGL